MKRALCLLLVLSALLPIWGCSPEGTIEEISYEELGAPSAQRYHASNRARCPWDMILWEGKLYIGGGDYNDNAGPVDIWVYDIKEREWQKSGTVPDQEVWRFCVIDNTLVVPGIDPGEDWTYGNYYALDDDEWIKHRTIPGGVHNFDMVTYDGKLFCGLGVEPGNFPISCSFDGGKTFSAVEMYKDGALIDTAARKYVRVYDLFVLNDALYAAFFYAGDDRSYDLYRYEEGAFVYDNQWYGKVHQMKYGSNIIGAKVVFDGRLFFTTGYLYVTDDMKNVTRLAFPQKETVYDLIAEGDCLYALCGKKREDGKYAVSVWRHQGKGTDDFSELFNFTYDTAPLSFVCRDGIFYLGMGDSHSANEKNGTILRIKCKG